MSLLSRTLVALLNQGLQAGGLLQHVDAMIDGCNFTLASPELALLIEQVVNGRHKEVMAVTTGQITRKRRQETRFATAVFHHQDT